ncbi:REJ domain protein (macronuclear) [Tetrahymena thermophila SB210]|uniref:REJ domain protein n=1 Tax=Tetrahymena thermophila (strain SB210) TaxID=312017 RepID=Q23JU5_TETTS|nr:REJ domain protein [Tetrahymena thermophila SB210]EAR96765.3 REJ domain protein [Tetrahymena thermophila SB210]|eukprot:XP_001017010.3 REJ domain protein [Tetrahymena thermophila SB210]
MFYTIKLGFLNIKWILSNPQNFSQIVMLTLLDIITTANDNQSFTLFIPKLTIPVNTDISIKIAYTLKVSQSNTLSFTTKYQQMKQIIISPFQSKQPPIYRQKRLILTYFLQQNYFFSCYYLKQNFINLINSILFHFQKIYFFSKSIQLFSENYFSSQKYRLSKIRNIIQYYIKKNKINKKKVLKQVSNLIEEKNKKCLIKDANQIIYQLFFFILHSIPPNIHNLNQYLYKLNTKKYFFQKNKKIISKTQFYLLLNYYFYFINIIQFNRYMDLNTTLSYTYQYKFRYLGKIYFYYSINYQLFNIFQVSVQISSDASISSTNTLSVAYTVPQIQILIQNGSDMLVNYKNNLTLIGLARDYEIQDPNTSQGIQLSWHCRSLQVQNGDNQCYTYKKEVYVPQNTQNITIDGGTFNPYQILSFTIQGSKDSRTSQYSSLIIFAETDLPPLLVVFDDPRQLQQININEDIHATLIYGSNVPSDILTYAGAILYNNLNLGLFF